MASLGWVSCPSNVQGHPAPWNSPSILPTSHWWEEQSPGRSEPVVQAPRCGLGLTLLPEFALGSGRGTGDPAHRWELLKCSQGVLSEDTIPGSLSKRSATHTTSKRCVFTSCPEHRITVFEQVANSPGVNPLRSNHEDDRPLWEWKA